MAPEQIEHPQEVDHRADIYSLGVVFYQMLTGELPIGRFAPPSKKVQIDVRLDEVVLRALEKEPERRYQQASEIKTEVETIRQTPKEEHQAGTAGTRPLAGTADDGLVQARQLVQGPAIGLLITGVLNWLVVPVIVIVMAYKTLGFASGPMPLVVPLIVALLMSLFFSSFVIFASLKMMRLESFGLASAASILAILVSPTNLIGLGIGIWALVVLNRAEVRTAFDRRDRSRTHIAPVPATPRQRRLGITALVLCLLAIPVSLLGSDAFLSVFQDRGHQPGELHFSLLGTYVFLSFFLIEGIALICGIAGRRSLAGKAAAILSPLFLVLGVSGFSWALISPIHRDFSGWPSVQRLGPSGLHVTDETGRVQTLGPGGQSPPAISPPSWDTGPDGPVLTDELARQILQLSPEKTQAVNSILQAAFREGFAVESQHTKQETRKERACGQPDRPVPRGGAGD